MLRGALQTGLSWLFAGGLAQSRYRVDLGSPAADPAPGAQVTVAPMPGLPAHWPGARARWAAILISSFLFALLHQPWMIQLPIFLLALALGYLYERTGNLWSCIFMHMFFNAAQFALFFTVGPN